jgi:methyltransferase (TIGR00027 family)
MEAAAKTGFGPTALVAIEQHFPKAQRIVDDEVAREMLPSSAKAFLGLMRIGRLRDWLVRRTERDTPGLWALMMSRKRYVDEQLSAARSNTAVMLNLGAGFDTRAYRLPALASVPVWEIDQRENIEAKERRLRELFGAVPKHVKLVAMDFDRDDVAGTLASRGYVANKRVFFVWEAVTQYLTETAVRTVFEFLARAAPYSRLVFTYVRKDFIDGRALYGWDEFYRKSVVAERIWRFGMEPEAWPDFLANYGWRLTEDVGYEVLVERYVRPTGRHLVATPIERIIYAQKI